MNEKISVGIVGAGAIGLSAARALTDLGVEDVVVIDRAPGLVGAIGS